MKKLSNWNDDIYFWLLVAIAIGLLIVRPIDNSPPRKNIDYTLHELVNRNKVAAPVVAAAPAPVANVSAGQSLYAGCAGCHGVNGEGGFGPAIAGSTTVAQDLKDFRSRDRINAIMNGQASGLSDQDIEDLARYIGNL